MECEAKCNVVETCAIYKAGAGEKGKRDGEKERVGRKYVPNFSGPLQKMLQKLPGVAPTEALMSVSQSWRENHGKDEICTERYMT